MMLMFINLAQFLIKAIPLTLAIAYIAFLVSLPVRKLLKNQLLWLKKLKLKTVWAIALASPIILIFITYLALVINDSLVAPRYHAWSKKCGHSPVIGVDGTFEHTKDAYTGNFTDDDGVLRLASRYFCSLDEAKAAGYTKL